MAFLSSFKGESPFLQSVGFWGTKIYEERSVILMYGHLILSALFPIYIGSYSSLRRPPSAQDPPKKKGDLGLAVDEDDEEDELEEHTEFGGLTPSDAIMFPIFAGSLLGGLYLLIKWLQDPAILNLIFGYYFSALGVFSVGNLVGDFLNVVTTFIFPKAWSSGNQLYNVDPLLRQQVTDASIVGVDRAGAVHFKFTDKTVPFPGVMSSLKMKKEWSDGIWSLRSLLTNHWFLRVFVHGLVSTKAKVRLNNVIGFMFGVGAIALYNFNGKSWWISNIMSWGFCYSTLQYLSTTTFWTGSLVLTGLFFYDIAMVFYTPMMITVATKLDVPIKLSIPGPGTGSMLGLGDIVLPGIMMALALRFDLYLFYLRKGQNALPAASNSIPSSILGSTKTVAETKTNEKPIYIPATGAWGTSYWTRSMPKDKLPANLKASSFPKVYFRASIVGYVVGMCATLCALTIYKHGQPALLYLVPGVLGALWGTALVRGEIKEMWDYSEANEEEDESKVKEEQEDNSEVSNMSDKKDIEMKEQKESEKVDDHAHHVFLFSLSWPRQGPKKTKALLA